MAIKNAVSISFDRDLSIVDSVFDCRLPGVMHTVVDLMLDSQVFLSWGGGGGGRLS